MVSLKVVLTHIDSSPCAAPLTPHPVPLCVLAAQMWGGFSGLVWAYSLPFVVVQTMTLGLNTVCHLWGARPYDTGRQGTAWVHAYGAPRGTADHVCMGLVTPGAPLRLGAVLTLPCAPAAAPAWTSDVSCPHIMPEGVLTHGEQEGGDQ